MKNKLLSILIAALVFATPTAIFAQTPNLGSATNFAVFTAVGQFDNVGAATLVTGDVGTNVGAFNAFPPGVLLGAIHVADATSALAAIDVANAYASLAAVPCGAVLGVTLGSGQTLVPNVYCTGAATTLNGNLILDGQNDPNAIFIFQIDGAFATGIASNISLINGASLCNVYWQINGQFDLGDNSIFRGIVITNGAINLLEGSTLYGHILSVAGAVSLHNNLITMASTPTPATVSTSGPISFCEGDSVTLGGNIDGVWNTGESTPSITVKIAGEYFVTNTTVCGSDTSNHIVVIVNPLPIAPLIIGGPTTFCSGDSVILSGNTNGGVWSTGALTDSIIVKLPGDYFVVQTNSCGNDTSNHILVTVNPLPISLPILINGPNTFCLGDSAILSGNTNGGVWSTGALTDSIIVKLPGDYFVVQTNSCGNDTSNHILVTVNPRPVAPVIIIIGSTSFCPGDSVILFGNTNGGVWSTGALTDTITVKSAGDYFVIQINSCGFDSSNHIIITIDTVPDITLEPLNAIACADSFANFTVSATGTNLVYQWRRGNVILTDSGNVSGATTSILTINPVSDTDTASDYNVIVSGTCLPNDTSTYASLSLCPTDTFISCHFPNTITPNEDGVNDEFYITCNEDYPNSDVRIYNRWGVEVFRSLNHYDNKWDAHNQQNTKLPDGTYFYIYYFNDGSKRIKKGFIDVYR